MAPPFLCVYKHLFIGENFSFFPNCFVQHLYFDLKKKSNINIDSIRKINDFKNNALKAQRIENTFEIWIL